MIKFVTKKQIEELEAKAGSLRRSIEDAKIIAKGGSEGLKMAIDRFKAYRIFVINKKNDGLDENTSPTRMLRSVGWRGQEKAMDMVISTFENSKNDADYFGPQLIALEKQINEWKKLPVRE